MCLKSMDKSKALPNYLPQVHFKTSISLKINQPIDQVAPYLESIDFTQARISYWLFTLRGIQVPDGSGFDTGSHDLFIKLPVNDKDTLALGVVGKFWRTDGQLVALSSDEFLSFSDPAYAKSTWIFRLKEVSKELTILNFVNQIYCPNQKVYRKFERYWTLIKPLSYLVKLEILMGFRKQLNRLDLE